MVIARDVRFNERCFPYSAESGKDEKLLVVLPPLEQEGDAEPESENVEEKPAWTSADEEASDQDESIESPADCAIRKTRGQHGLIVKA